MKRLLSYMKAYRTESILGPLFKMLEASFELFVPLVVASMIDVGSRGEGYGLCVSYGRLSGAPWSDRPGLLPHRAVFCSQGSHRSSYGSAQ